jgi:endoglucanase
MVLVAGLGAGLLMGGGSALGSDAPLAISIDGNQFVNQDGATVQLHGVNQESTEYACYYGYAYASSPLDAADAAAIASWHANAVRIPLNEDCWLGINGLPGYGSAAGYQQAIEDYVQDLNADGIYAILDLHWSADGTAQSAGQQEMPDGHSAAFWTSVATAFQSDPAVLFDIFNEPEGDDQGGNYPVSWSCWLDGGCTVPNVPDGAATETDPPTYTAVGMQALVNAIRATGASQPIIVGGLNYANDLSQWLSYEPSDPANPTDPQIAASFHNYNGEACDTETCWSSTIAPVAAQVPVVTGEFDEDDCPTGGGDDPRNFDNTYMTWADAHGVSYLAWGWLVLDPSDQNCSALYLINDYTNYTPADPNGVALHDHLAALADPTGTTTGTTTITSPPTTTTSPTTTTTGPTTTTTSSTQTTGTTTTTTATTTTTKADTTPTTTGPSRPSKPSLRLSVISVTIKGRRLTLRAATTPGFSGRLYLSLSVSYPAHHRRRVMTLRARPQVKEGACTFKLKLPAGAGLRGLTLSYPGGLDYGAARVTRPGGRITPGSAG